MKSKILKQIIKFEKDARAYLANVQLLDSLAKKAEAKSKKNADAIGGARKKLEILIRLMRAWATGRYRGARYSNLLIIVGAVLYFLDPIDVVPDFLPLVGLSDDLSVLMFAMSRLKQELDAFEEWESTVDLK